jgi:Putative transposase of IS4/5 family (DUF4096)
MARYGRLLTDAQWEKIRPLLPKPAKRPRGGRPPVDNRRVLEGPLWILRSGARWCDLEPRASHREITPKSRPGIKGIGSRSLFLLRLSSAVYCFVFFVLVWGNNLRGLGDQSAYSDEGDQDSELIVISVPGLV